MKMLYGMETEKIYNAALEIQGGFCFCHFIFCLSYFFCYKMIGGKKNKKRRKQNMKIQKVNFDEINYDKLAIAIINSFESDREESGRRELVKGMNYVVKKYKDSSNAMSIVDDVLITFTGWSLESLVELSTHVTDDEVDD